MPKRTELAPPVPYRFPTPPALARSPLVNVADLVDRPTVYRLFDAARTLLYVGVTNNIGARLAEHAGTKSWWRDVRFVSTAHFADRADAVTAEAIAIGGEAPFHNRQVPEAGFGAWANRRLREMAEFTEQHTYCQVGDGSYIHHEDCALFGDVRQGP